MTVRRYFTIMSLSLLAMMVLAACNPFDLFGSSAPETDISLTLAAEPGGWSAVYPKGIREQSHSGDVPASNPSACPTAITEPLLLSVSRRVHLNVTSAQDLTALCVPALGLKVDAIPGRLNEAWVKPMITGRFCGTCLTPTGDLDQASTIIIDVVSQAKFETAMSRPKSDK